MATANRHDAIILGGGLAGLTLALQLKRRFADLDILVLERRMHPVPIAAHKVGESTVEIGAHYFAEVLGLKQHLDDAQLKKFGFRFFSSRRRRDIDGVTEIGASRYLPVPSYQIDRGIFENFLAEEAARRGIRFVDGATVRDIELAADGGEHRVASHTRRRRTRGARALAGRCLRPRRPDQEEARARRAERARRQRGLVPHEGADRRSTTGRRRDVARALRPAARAGSRPITWSARATGPG